MPQNRTGNRFQPGQSGNPGGRPKQAKELSAWLRDKKFSKLTEREKLWERAQDSDYLMVKLLEYAFGKPLQSVEASGNLTVRVEYANGNDQPA